MRVLIALDINDEDLEAGDCTWDDVEEGLRARLSEFYPSSDGGETRATLYSAGDVTESFDFLMSAVQVGMEGPLEAPEDYGTTSRVVDEAEVALIRLTKNENTDANGRMPVKDEA